MAPTNLQLEKQSNSNDSVTIYRATGKIALESVNEFIQRLRPEEAHHLVLDLSGVSFMDSAGVGALVSLFVHRRSRSETLALAGLGRQAQAVVTVAGLQKLLPICGSLEEAVGKAVSRDS